MTISMYKTSVPIFVQFLTSMSTVLDKAALDSRTKCNRAMRTEFARLCQAL